MKTTLIAALLCTAIVTLPSAHAQQTDAGRKQFLECEGKAEQGDASAQNDLGDCYYDRQGVAKDETAAVKWYRKAAEQNFAEAQKNPGWCYFNGRGVATNYVEAVTWYRKAAEQNYALAQDNLGVCYHEGQGVAKDEVEAYGWHNLGAKTSEEAAKHRDALAATMSPTQVADGKTRTEKLRARIEAKNASTVR